ncbi:hypothetical protein [Roseinatronobacter alkalisoli]|uniref:Uncharacterized protein n=1 Tax=Roseinatronobacter alkalisoli TaxID=3028235 RepID=A0ABT5TCZ1_9RHOB|nr:hypothetical protein [Roseinatronobacter sp. HJB301]MDD7972969.1 hypothetical protein [Roseinatronobacter sp. HJB301]
MTRIGLVSGDKNDDNFQHEMRKARAMIHVFDMQLGKAEKPVEMPEWSKR